MKQMQNKRTWITLAFFGVLLVQPIGLGQGNPEVALRVAMETETVEGDLNAAIEQYGKIAESSDRALAARALIRMAGCYEKLGIAESRKIYERVVRDYADQKEAAQVARTKLGTAHPSAAVKGDRVVWAAEMVDSSGRVSSDGRFISYTDWITTGNLMLRDIVTGIDRPLTGNKDWSGPGNAIASAFSPDGKRIAFGWTQYQPRRCEIRVLSFEERGVPKAHTLYADEDLRSLGVTDWSSDGRWLAIRLKRRDNTSQIAIFKIEDASLRILKTVGWRGPEKVFFSPDGNHLAYDLPAADEIAQRDVFIMAVDGSRETRIVDHPAHDVMMGWSPDGNLLLFASNRTDAMGFWAVPVTDGKAQAAPTMLKPDVGSICRWGRCNSGESLGLTASGALYITKNSSTESLRVAPIDLDSGKLTGAPVANSYRSSSPDWSRDGNSLAYVSAGSDGIPVISIRLTRSGEVRELRPGLLYMNHLRWLPDGRSLMIFARDFDGRSGIYRIDAETGANSFVTTSRAIRFQVSPDGKKIYVHDPEERRAVRALDLVSGESTLLSRAGEISPDGRYMAFTRTDEDNKANAIMIAAIAGGEEKEIIRVDYPERFGGQRHLCWTPDSRALVAVKVRASPGDPYGDEGPKALWLVPVGDGKARKLDIDINEWNLAGIQLHPKGDQIAFFSGKDAGEVWAYENLLPTQSASQ